MLPPSEKAANQSSVKILVRLRGRHDQGGETHGIGVASQ